MRPEANITEVVGIWGFFHSVPSFGSEGISCIAPSHHLPAEVEKCMYYQHTYLNQQSIEKEVFKKQLSVSSYYLIINPKLTRHISQKEESTEMEKSMEIQKPVKCSFNCLSYKWNLICTQQSSNQLEIEFKCSCPVMGWLASITRTLTPNMFGVFLLGEGVGGFFVVVLGVEREQAGILFRLCFQHVLSLYLSGVISTTSKISVILPLKRFCYLASLFLTSPLQ